ncbi:fatty acid desaturase [Neotabrizicola sp. sgz301269]|uniref:fatty acid desaturase n=1 Tax=Neotabrizicola sp. sgz301269 TaxID=3276282 RepID=UPI00376FEF50
MAETGHKTFLATFPAEEKAVLTARSDAAGLRHLAGHLGLIALISLLILLRVPLWPLLLPVQGVLLVFLFTLEHECTHKTPFASERLNEAAGRACGLVLVLPFEWFRYFHLAHHRWTNLPGKDPELDSDKPASLRAWTWHVSGLPYWNAGIALLWSQALGRVQAPYLPEAALPRMQREARILLALYALAVASLLFSPALLWLWLVPVLLGQPLLRLYLLAEHGDCPQVADMFLNTRTTFTTRIVRFLAWNMPYHAEHHTYPAVPFHQLPALHQRMKAHLKVTADGYAEFTRDYLTRRR